MDLTLTESSAGEWPPQLSQLSIGGIVNRDVFHAFDWPPALTAITLDYYPLLRRLKVALCSQVLRISLKGLHIRGDIFPYDEFEGSDILYQLPNLSSSGHPPR